MLVVESYAWCPLRLQVEEGRDEIEEDAEVFELLSGKAADFGS